MNTVFLRLALAAACALSSLASHASLPEPIARAAQAAGLPAEAIGLWIAPVGSGAATLQHNADQLMNPASVMKLLTSYAALDLLGPAHTWKTSAWLQGDLKQGVLHGNVLIAGSGDPSLTWDRLGQWLRDWRARGLREIRGKILIDPGLFAAAPAAAPFDEAPHRAYNAQPDAFLVNFGALSLRLIPGAVNAPVEAIALTPAAPLRIINQLKTTPGSCNGWRNQLRASFSPATGGLRLKLEGSLAESCGERQLNLKVGDSLRWAGLVIRAQWRELGGSWDGPIEHTRLSPAGAPFSSWESPTLPEVLRDMNKWSNNVMAQQVLLALGNDGSGPLSPEKGIARLQAWMPAQGLDAAQWIIENGSGLSRSARTTPAQLGQLLRAAWQSPRMPEFLMAQPVIGKDGTLRSRLVDSPLAGRGFVKTGTLDGVKSAAGYVLDAKGNWQAFALLLNHPQAPGAEGVMEAVLREIYER